MRKVFPVDTKKMEAKMNSTVEKEEKNVLEHMKCRTSSQSAKLHADEIKMV